MIDMLEVKCVLLSVCFHRYREPNSQLIIGEVNTIIMLIMLFITMVIMIMITMIIMIITGGKLLLSKSAWNDKCSSSCSQSGRH